MLSETAFHQLYHTYWKKLYAYAYSRTQSRDVAFEIVQEIFVSLWERRAKVDVTASWQAYLFSAAKLQVLAFMRQSSLLAQYKKDYALFATTPAGNYTEQSVLKSDLLEALKRGIEALPPQCREITRLSLLENLSIDKIAMRLNISRFTVKNQLSLGRKYLKLSLGEYTLLVLLAASCR